MGFGGGNEGLGNLMSSAILEDTMATGVQETGEAANLSYMIDQIIEMLPNLSGLDKVRFLCILFISQRGVLDEEMEQRVSEAANLSPFDMSIFEKLEVLAGDDKNDDEEDSGFNIGEIFGGKKAKVRGNVNTVESNGYGGMRYAPDVKNLLGQMLKDQLSPDDYPGTQPLPTFKTMTAESVRTRRKTSKWSKDKKKKKTYSGARQIVFILGGMCMSELRSGYECMDDDGEKEIIMCSTEFLSPTTFLENIRNFH